MNLQEQVLAALQQAPPEWLRLEDILAAIVVFRAEELQLALDILLELQQIERRFVGLGGKEAEYCALAGQP